MNEFGGNWTSQKIDLVEDYAKAYLTIMNKYPQFRLMYFDGFAGSGEITVERKKSSPEKLEIDFSLPDLKVIEGAAKRIVSIKTPKPFDMYYFVELGEKKAEKLKEVLQKETDKELYVAAEDCNVKLKDLAKFLKSRKGGFYKVLAFIDPFGMNVKWSAIEALKGLSIDMWILVPTGLGANRLLKKDKQIPESWLLKLEEFFGLSSEEILPLFYSETESTNLFGEPVVVTTKKDDPISKIQQLYAERMKTVFEYTSNPYAMKNRSNSIMFHFFLASNNATAVKIANQMINKLQKGSSGRK